MVWQRVKGTECQACSFCHVALNSPSASCGTLNDFSLFFLSLISLQSFAPNKPQPQPPALTCLPHAPYSVCGSLRQRQVDIKKLISKL